jgi:hypothetical protein
MVEFFGESEIIVVIPYARLKKMPLGQELEGITPARN